ncbi:MAG: alpha/beta fold hydrolase [Kordiimonadaceae bacterium]|nr:alpha/beta fold hydrolase [Kordiimonadaceae bacterium]MBO6567688.1 alpha/beta fold hydrolase [Kordiimonadaceae bacterium]MBO6963098.1 alpha/beta fold hydrolase [Kordiimonadaceae bacterium]
MEILGQGLRSFLADCPLQAFRTRVPWFGGDLQTLRNSFVRSPGLLNPDSRLQAPIDVGAISVAINQPTNATKQDKILLLVHGLGGAEDSTYMLNSARYFNAQGYTVARMNYRGVGPSKEYSEPPYSAGLTSDLRAVLRWLNNHWPGFDVFLMGFSLGGQLSLRMLGEGDVPHGLKACVSVSAPLDLATSQKKLERPRNFVYSRYVVNNMRADLAGLVHPKVTADPTKLASVLAFDQEVIAPVFGFRDAQDYYARVSSLPLIGNIKVPTLAIHAADDPWIPVEDYHAAAWSDGAPVGACITPSGGHVGFHAKGQANPWYENAAHQFFDAVSS